MCVCVCVCVRSINRSGERERGRERELQWQGYDTVKEWYCLAGGERRGDVLISPTALFFFCLGKQFFSSSSNSSKSISSVQVFQFTSVQFTSVQQRKKGNQNQRSGRIRKNHIYIYIIFWSLFVVWWCVYCATIVLLLYSAMLYCATLCGLGRRVRWVGFGGRVRLGWVINL